MLAAVASLPIVVVLALMLGARFSAARAGLAGLLTALLLAWTVFEPQLNDRATLGPLLSTVGMLAEAAFLSLSILWIILPALAIHEFQGRTGALDVLRDALGSLSGDPRVTALLVGWFFALFMEGAAGFGTSAALAAPFLVSAGFNRVQAVTIAMLGHTIGVSFGAVGTPILAQVAATGFTGQQLAGPTALYQLALGWVMPFVLVALAASGPRGARGAFGWAALAGASFLVPFGLSAYFIGPELPTLAGALLGGVAFVAVLRFRAGKRAETPRVSPRPADVWRAGAPYLALVLLVLLTRLIGPVRDALQDWRIGWTFGGTFTGEIALLYHPGTLLMLALLLGAWARRASARDVTGAVTRAAGKLGLVLLALLAMLALSRVMVHAGLTDALAAGAVLWLGGAWPLVAPFVGVLGTFVTGSATASNILFSPVQRVAADALGVAATTVLGAQGFGAAIGNAICPHNVVAASATVQLTGREGEVLRRTLWVVLAYALAGGLLAWLALTA